MPSASPFFGEVNTSSEGIFGLNSILEPSANSLPPQKIPSEINPTVKSVPFDAV